MLTNLLWLPGAFLIAAFYFLTPLTFTFEVELLFSTRQTTYHKPRGYWCFGNTHEN